MVARHHVGVAAGPTASFRTTRESILDEAVVCFAATGYDGTSLNDIAAGVGIRRPSLLHHFASKEALYGEVFERLLSDWFDRLDAAVVRRRSIGWEKVELVLRAGFEYFVDNPDLRAPGPPRGHRRRRPPRHRPRRRAAPDVRPGRRVLRSGRWTSGTFRQQDPEQLLLTGYGALLSYFSDAPFLERPARHRPARPARARRSAATTSWPSSTPRLVPDARRPRRYRRPAMSPSPSASGHARAEQFEEASTTRLAPDGVNVRRSSASRHFSQLLGLIVEEVRHGLLPHAPAVPLRPEAGRRTGARRCVGGAARHRRSCRRSV